ncbi:RNA pyrophosphohydrolase [Amaricoccus tamworthensis]|uniref:RNA pyrophosphohydrolase n=1 Tax=Amaricoccus tamworthensis TaxID=57002 RepID=UPI003C7ED809
MTPEEIAKLPYRPCVGVVLMNREGLVFAGQRIDNPGNAWQMPQGGIDPDEKPRKAAFRELKEETGVPRKAVELVTKTKGWLKYDLPHELVPNLWKGKYRGQKQRWFLMRFTGDDSKVNIATEIPEFSTWAWKSPDELIDLIVPFKREIYAAVFRDFSEHLAKA